MTATTSETIGEIAQALVKLQSDPPEIIKNATNSYLNTTFADLPSILDVIGPVITGYGLAVSQFPSTEDGKPALATYLLHESGEWIRENSVLVLTNENLQGQGSGVTYMRRQAVLGVLGLAPESDRDGEPSQSQRTAPAQQPRQAEAAPQQTTRRAAAQQQSLAGKVTAAAQGRPQPAPAQPKGDRDKYDWVNNAAAPTPDLNAKVASEKQLNRLFAIAKTAEVDAEEVVESLWPGAGATTADLDWRMYKYITNAIEDGYVPGGNEGAAAPYDDSVFEGDDSQF